MACRRVTIIAAIYVGELHSGDKNNIIPETAELVLNTRYYKPEIAMSKIT